MKIAVRGGHNFQATGAAALLNEVVEDRLVKDDVIADLKAQGHQVLDVTPGNCNSDSDLAYGINQAKAWGAELFISIHFNKAYSSYNGAIGTECWVYSTNDNLNDEVYAQRIANSISSLGFRNRGVKVNTGLYELRKGAECGMKSVIVEVCFVEATEDVALYNRVGHAAVGRKIAEGITNQAISGGNTSQPTPPPQTGFSVGDKVKVSTSAQTYATGEKIASFVLGNTYTIQQLKSDRALLKEIRSWVFLRDLSIGNGAGSGSTTQPTTPPASTGKYLNLPPSATSWNVYPLDKAPVVANACGKLLPNKFGGISYEIKGTPQSSVVIIDTASYGRVQIYCGSDTSATITSYPVYVDNSSSSSDKYGIVANTGGVGVNVRSSATSTQNNVLGALSEGTKVKLASKVGSWWSVYYGNNGGFIHGDYIKQI